MNGTGEELIIIFIIYQADQADQADRADRADRADDMILWGACVLQWSPAIKTKREN